MQILIFGDSITYGLYDEEDSGWVNRLRKKLENNKKEKYTIYNLGIPGDRTYNLMNRFDIELNSRLKNDEEKMVVFAIGINDTQECNGKINVDLQTFKNNIQDLIDKSKKYTNDIIFIGLTNVDEKRVGPFKIAPEKRYVNDYIINYDDEIEKICNKNHIKYIKTFGMLDDDDLFDGLHPNSNGHKKLYEKILNDCFCK